MNLHKKYWRDIVSMNQNSVKEVPRECVSDIIKSIPIARNYSKRKKSDKTLFRNCMCAFDIETTYLDDVEQSIMYIWQFAVMDLRNGNIWYCFGRTWEQFTKLLDSFYHEGITVLVWVHNLSYEFQFMRHWLPFQKDKIFALKSRKVVRADIDGVQFRCSYIQTNKSLDAFTRDMGVVHQKLSGVEFDYSKKRYPWTEMTTEELQYCCNDVVGLLESMQVRMRMENDTLYSLPLTSTGYVRRLAKEAMRKFNHNQLQAMMCDVDVYKLLRLEFRGGDTHANRYHVNKILENVASYDRASSYPDVMLNYRFPMSAFTPRMITDIGELEKKCQIRDCCFIAVFTITNLQQRDIYYGAPYLSLDKAVEISGQVVDNGRILSANKAVYVFNDIDWEIVKSEYVGEVEISQVYIAKYGYLPQAFRDLVIDLFHKKTSLKNVDGQELNYMRSKELINSLYGMCAQNPVKPDVIYMDEPDQAFTLEDIVDIGEKLEKYNKKAFLLYAWGCWVTAWARLKLKEMINIVGDNFVYCDTDSVKFLVRDDYKRIVARIEEYNQGLKELSISNKGYADDKKGITHYLGVYEYEETYKQFKTLGAKKYAYTRQDGTFKITIAGVPKKAGAREMGTIENFNVGFVFRNSGKLESVYNDSDYGTYYTDDSSEHRIEIRSNVVLRESTYEIGLSLEYMYLLASVGNWDRFITQERLKWDEQKIIGNQG
nr:MAG TPA: DNA polymerase B [Caudoviricetes sp.]